MGSVESDLTLRLRAEFAKLISDRFRRPLYEVEGVRLDALIAQKIEEAQQLREHHWVSMTGDEKFALVRTLIHPAVEKRFEQIRSSLGEKIMQKAAADWAIADKSNGKTRFALSIALGVFTGLVSIWSDLLSYVLPSLFQPDFYYEAEGVSWTFFTTLIVVSVAMFLGMQFVRANRIPFGTRSQRRAAALVFGAVITFLGLGVLDYLVVGGNGLELWAFLQDESTVINWAYHITLGAFVFGLVAWFWWTPIKRWIEQGRF